jgi:type I restriction enzyme S subunit
MPSMSEQATVLLRDLLLDTKDGDWGKGEPTDGYAPVHVIRGTDFAPARLGHVGGVPLRHFSQKTMHRRLLRPEDILIETAGGSRDRPTGRSLLITERLLTRFPGPVSCASFARCLRVDPDRANPRYVYWYLQDLYNSGGMWEHQVQHTGVARFQYTRFASTVGVPLPSRARQDAVAEILGALDDKIVANGRLALTHERLLGARAQRLGIEDEPEQSDAVRVRVTELVEFNPKTPKPSSGTDAVYVDMAALSTSRAGIDTWTRREPKGGTRFRNGDTLFARITPCLENGKTGYVDFMADGEIGMGSTEFIVLRSRPGVPREFSYFLARSERFREHAVRNMVGSSGRQRVSATDASNYLVPSLDDVSLAAFGEAAATAFSHMRSLGQESRTLGGLRDTLLPGLMSGELRVRDAERLVRDAV